MDLVVTALNLAAVYGLIAIGLSLAWAGLGFLNLAHGVTFATAGYGAWWFAEHVSAGPVAVVGAGVVSGALMGVVVYLVAFLPLDGRPNFEIRHLIATLAIALIGTNVLLEIFGPGNRTLPSPFGDGAFRLRDAVVTADRSGAILSAVVVLGVVLLALRRSRLGLGVRALTQNTEGAALVGIDRKTAALVILAVSGALAGLSSVLLAQTFYVAPGVGFLPLVKGLIIALLGGLGSIPGAILAALLVGATEAVTSTYLGGQFVLMTLFLLIAVVLLMRPRGLGGVLEGSRV